MDTIIVIVIVIVILLIFIGGSYYYFEVYGSVTNSIGVVQPAPVPVASGSTPSVTTVPPTAVTPAQSAPVPVIQTTGTSVSIPPPMPPAQSPVPVIQTTGTGVSIPPPMPPAQSPVSAIQNTVTLPGVATSYIATNTYNNSPYYFNQGSDSAGGDYAYRPDLANNIPALVSACNGETYCRGFNTNGYLKDVIWSPTQWTNWTSDPTKGLYINSTPLYPNKHYTFYPGKDSPNGDINQATAPSSQASMTPGYLFDACDRNSSCTGFNTNGWLKSTVSPQSQWTTWTSDTTKGLYTKG